MTNPADLDLVAAGRALRSGGLHSRALVQACLDRIAQRDPKIGAFVYLAAEQALLAADSADAALAQGNDLGPLHGIPFAVKDVFDVAGWPVRFGCAFYADRIADKNAVAVDRCIAAGAIPLGMVATYELATVGPDSSALYPQPRNPWNGDHITGGSSSGSAAAVAARMVRFALGSDTGGSARSPAAYCGVAGFKPTRGWLGQGGLMPLAPSMDEVGLLATTAADLACVFRALDAGQGAPTDRTHRIAYGRDWCIGTGIGTQAAILPLMDDAAATLSLLGAQVDLVSLPDYAPLEADAATVLLSEQAGSHWGALEFAASKVGRMAYASLASGIGISADALHSARAAASQFATALDHVLTGHDALILPTTMTTAPRFSDFAGGQAVWTAMRTIPFNLGGHPAISVPIGFHQGLPLGMQIIGAKGADDLVLTLATAFEAATDHSALDPCRA